MISTVVAERDHLVPLLYAIKDDAGDSAAATQISYGDVVEGLAITVMNLERLPVLRKHRLNSKAIDL